MQQNSQASATLLISCPDRRGLVAAISQFIASNNGNILHLDQHVDAQESVFFMRVEWELDGFLIAQGDIARAFQPISEQYGMQWEIRFSDQTPNMAIFVSKQAHCLYDILS